MLIRFTLLALAFVCSVPFAGCGGSSEPTVSASREDMQAYLDEHPELVVDVEDLDVTPPQE